MAKETGHTYKCGDMPKRCYSFFEEMRNKTELCDITFQLENESVSAHRIIIAAAIPYFRSMLSTKSSQQCGENIVLPDIEPAAFKYLLQFAYSCEVQIDTENVRELLSAACYLSVKEVQQACCDFLGDILEPENVINTRELAGGLNCVELLDSTHCYIKENFTAVSQTKDFSKLPLAYLKELINEDDLNVNNERDVLHAVMKWVNEFPEDRSSMLPELLLKIRMPLIEPQCLANIVKTERLIQTSTVCRDLLDEAKNYNLLPKLRNTVCSFQIQPRLSSSNTYSTEEESNRCIFLLSSETHYSLQFYDPLKEKWSSEVNAKYFNNHGSTAEVRDRVYFFEADLSAKFDLFKNMDEHFVRRFHVEYTIPTPRMFAGVASIGNKIYVCGGRQCKSASKAVECYDTEKEEWEILSSMPTACWSVCTVALGKYIYVLGGKDEWYVYDHVQRYDSERKKWKTMPAMLSKRYYAGAAALNGKIYVCGGATNLLPITGIATAEVYDTFKNTWQYISPMNSSYCGFFLLSCRGKLYALGGKNDNAKYIHDFEIYDIEKDEWSLSCCATRPTFRISGAVVI